MKWILLDSQSIVDVISNPHIVKNIRKCPDGGSVMIHCNAGTRKVKMVADLKNYETVWFDPGAIAKILSLARVTQRFRVLFDSKEGGFFKVHSKTRDMVFQRSSNGLYCQDFTERAFMLVSTVEENKEGFTNREVDDAKQARQTLGLIGYPSDRY